MKVYEVTVQVEELNTGSIYEVLVTVDADNVDEAHDLVLDDMMFETDDYDNCGLSVLEVEEL